MGHTVLAIAGNALAETDFPVRDVRLLLLAMEFAAQTGMVHHTLCFLFVFFCW